MSLAGKRVDAYRAGITAIIFILFLFYKLLNKCNYSELISLKKIFLAAFYKSEEQ